MNKLHGILDTIISRQKTTQLDYFHFHSQDNVWTRVLRSPSSTTYEYIEVNLTPSPFNPNASWVKDVEPIIIRSIVIPPSPDDRFVNELPIEIYHLMLDSIGIDMTNHLLYSNLISQVNLSVLRCYGASGAKLEDIINIR